MKQDTYSYKGWMTSDSILKRTMAVFGYWWLGYFIVMLPAAIVIIILSIFLAGAP